MTMRLIAVNVGQPRQVVWKGRTITTGIFEEPVAGRVPLRQHNLDRDAQTDVSVHGGPSKAQDVEFCERAKGPCADHAQRHPHSAPSR